MTAVTVEEMLRNLTDFLKKVKTGETLIIMDNNQPVAELKPVGGQKKSKLQRPFGLAAGQFVVPDDFNNPLPEEILRDFEGK